MGREAAWRALEKEGPLAAAPPPSPRLAALKRQVAADPDYLLSPKTKPAEGPWGRGEIEKGGG